MFRKWKNYSAIFNNRNGLFNLVYLHAFGGSFWNKSFLFNKFDDCNFYGFEQPGNGEYGDYEKSDISINKYVELAVEFIIENDLKNIILFGHSMGGGICLSLANNPLVNNRIKAMILEAPKNPAVMLNYQSLITKLIPNTLQDMQLITNELFFDPLKIFKTQKNLDLFIQKEFERLNKKQDLKAILTEQAVISNLEIEHTNIANNKIKTLLLLGKYDQIVPLNESLQIFSKNDIYQIEVIDETKHVVVLEKMELCVKLISDFINSIVM